VIGKTHPQVVHFIDDECVVRDKRVSADDSQVGEQGAERGQAGHAKHEKVVGDFEQKRESYVLVVGVDAAVKEDDLHEALHHLAARQLREARFVVPNIDTGAH